MLFEKFFKIIKKSLQNQSYRARDSYVIYIKCSFSALRSSLFTLHFSLFSPAARSSVTQKRDLREPSPMEKVPRNEADEVI